MPRKQQDIRERLRGLGAGGLPRTEIAAIRDEARNDNEALETRVNSALARLEKTSADLAEEIAYLKRLTGLRG